MLAGMKTCSHMEIYYDKKLQRSVHSYFIGKIPSYIDDEIVIYDIEEYYYGMKVIKITIPNNFPVVEIEIDDNIENVKNRINKIFNNGFYSKYPDIEDLDKPVLEESRSDKSKTTITCD